MDIDPSGKAVRECYIGTYGSSAQRATENGRYRGTGPGVGGSGKGKWDIIFPNGKLCHPSGESTQSCDTVREIQRGGRRIQQTGFSRSYPTHSFKRRSTGLLDLDACMGTRLIGLTLDGKNLGTKMHGIYSCHGGVEQNNCYEDCLICNFSGSGLKMDWVWVFAVRRCRITNNRLYGIDVDRGYDGWVIDNNIVKNGLWGINVGPGMVCYNGKYSCPEFGRRPAC